MMIFYILYLCSLVSKDHRNGSFPLQKEHLERLLAGGCTMTQMKWHQLIS